ncbi:MAG: zinc-binding dehydrogenase, partial [Longimicrobiales bacterium]
MRAGIFEENGGPEVIEVGEFDTPEPGPGEVRIRVGAASMNHLDLWVRRGLPIETPMPHIGGSDFAGIVDETGPGAGHVPTGTRVVVDPALDYEESVGPTRSAGFGSRHLRLLGEHTRGGFAEYAVVPAENLVELPDDVSVEDAAAAGLVGVTAWRGLLGRGGLRPGERVLVTGASGGVGSMGVQIARLAGAQVYAVTSGPDSVEKARQLGAHVVYDRLEVDFAEELRADTGKEGVDLILDSVGEAVWNDCLKSLKYGGRLVTYGATTGGDAITKLQRVFWKQLSILGSTMGTPTEYREFMDVLFRG